MKNEELWTLFQVDQQRITALDGMMIAIRGWTVTLVAAIAGFALSQSEPGVLVAGLLGAVLFGYLDLRYRRTQLLHARRATLLEREIAPEHRLRAHLRKPEPGLADSPLRRYQSSLSFYGAVLVTQAVLWLVI